MTLAPLNFIATGPLSALSARRTHRGQQLTSTRRPAVAVASHTLNGQTITGPLKPSSHNILVKIAEASDKTAGGIILPDQAQEKPNFGEAVETGPGKILGNGVKVPMHIEKGDTILYGKYGGTSLTYDGEKHIVINQDDVLCKFKSGQYTVEACEPVFDRVLVKVGEIPDETEFGLIISNNAKEKPTFGEVVAVGPGRFMENGEMEPGSISIGEQVYYSSYAGTNITLEDEEYVVVRVADIFAKV